MELDLQLNNGHDCAWLFRLVYHYIVYPDSSLNVFQGPHAHLIHGYELALDSLGNGRCKLTRRVSLLCNPSAYCPSSNSHPIGFCYYIQPLELPGIFGVLCPYAPTTPGSTLRVTHPDTAVLLSGGVNNLLSIACNFFG